VQLSRIIFRFATSIAGSSSAGQCKFVSNGEIACASWVEIALGKEMFVSTADLSKALDAGTLSRPGSKIEPTKDASGAF